MPAARPWYEDIDWMKVAIFAASIAVMVIVVLAVGQLVVGLSATPPTPTAVTTK